MTSCNCLLFAIMKISLWQVSSNSFKHAYYVYHQRTKQSLEVQQRPYTELRIHNTENSHWSLNFGISLIANLLNLNSA